jgi:hypothetical protein
MFALHYCQLFTLHGTVFHGSQILRLRAKKNAPVLCLACVVYHVLILTNCILLGFSRSGTASRIKMLGAWSHERNLEDCRLYSTFNTSSGMQHAHVGLRTDIYRVSSRDTQIFLSWTNRLGAVH